MVNEWSLREEVLSTSHRWPTILLYCLVGALLGGLVSYIWPSPYQATTELYVALNIYRWDQDQNAVDHANGVAFNFPDDYKNWQMADLDAVIRMNDVMKETLQRLRAADDWWLGVSKEQLSGMLRTYWRNAGKWRLVAEAPDAQRAAEAVTVWQTVVFETLNAAMVHSREAMELHLQLLSVTDAETQLALRQAQLEEARRSMVAWQAAAVGQPESWTPAESERLQLKTAFETAAPGPVGQAVLQDFPDTEAPGASYLAWLERASLALDEEIRSVQAQAAALVEQRVEIDSLYQVAATKSYGFSPDLVVEPVSDGEPTLSVVRPTALLALIGGVLGLLVWAGVWIARITAQSRK